MPGTVEELIGARLDRLGPQAKRVVQVAAVLGRQFHREQLMRAARRRGHRRRRRARGARGARRDPSQDRALRRRVPLRREPDPGGRLRRPAAAPAARAARPHRAAARGAARASRPPSARRLLAHHYTRSENREKAVTALLRAARDAERVPSFRAAARFYRTPTSSPRPRSRSGAATPEAKRLVVEAGLGVLRMTVIYGIYRARRSRASRRGARRQLAEELGDAESLSDLCSLHGLVISSRGPAAFADGSRAHRARASRSPSAAGFDARRGAHRARARLGATSSTAASTTRSPGSTRCVARVRAARHRRASSATSGSARASCATACTIHADEHRDRAAVGARDLRGRGARRRTAPCRAARR